MAEPTPFTPSEWRELCSELLDRLRWYIQEDDTNRGGEWEDENAYWIKGQERAIQTVERASAALGVDCGYTGKGVDHYHPAPTPTAERLPKVTDCDEHGSCWFGSKLSFSNRWEWFFGDAIIYNKAGCTHWLPASVSSLPALYEVEK